MQVKIKGHCCRQRVCGLNPSSVYGCLYTMFNLCNNQRLQHNTHKHLQLNNCQVVALGSWANAVQVPLGSSCPQIYSVG